jgi:hypothetical protein
MPSFVSGQTIRRCGDGCLVRHFPAPVGGAGSRRFSPPASFRLPKRPSILSLIPSKGVLFMCCTPFEEAAITGVMPESRLAGHGGKDLHRS